jgi:hypothetical protein
LYASGTFARGFFSFPHAQKTIKLSFIEISKENRKGVVMNNRRPQKDIWLYRMIIAALAVTVIVTVVGAILLASTGVSLPDAVVALGAAAIGGMAGFLVPTHLNR